MSRVGPLDCQRPHRFPRVSGDEPDTIGYDRALTMFSPRERG